MFSRSEIHKGMKVRGNDGHVLGRIVELRQDELIVEKGLIRRHDFAVSLADVREVVDGEVVLNHGRDSLFSAPREVPHTTH
ncbi:DUF2171 domain-containing protein [Comamonas sp. JC664]|uniref:DUF2171 domain-containing protein n=1 Tax=Comamonas sp. JC664 TaxID=2801917 RepID=UPI001748EA34|nr:DUF2171 domain-containing protein [Comamonas sp. JC664]MBL0698792.1 hypothetical protein [Comamonas sp. JC664]GHG78928.1 hypothetical protein GCM10012319_30210 [Comamonas sp. KCTC 72670]